MKIIPAMDIIDGQVVRLHQGDYAQKTVYADDAVVQAQIFTGAGFNRLHLVDLSGAKEAKPVHAELFARIKKETGAVLEVGGGVRSLPQVEAYWQAGLTPGTDFIMIGSLPFKDRDEFNRICERYAQSILLTVDVWGREVRISGWQEKTSMLLADFLAEMTEQGLNNFLITQIQKDGTLQGPDFELYEEVLQKFPQVELIASGGVSSLEDLQRLAKLPLAGAILGKAYYEGRVNLDDLPT